MPMIFVPYYNDNFFFIQHSRGLIYYSGHTNDKEIRGIEKILDGVMCNHVIFFY